MLVCVSQQGRVYTINHKRDAASKPKRRTTGDEDEDEAADDAEGLPPQVPPVSCSQVAATVSPQVPPTSPLVFEDALRRTT
jgi:hypothetical protein